MPPRPLPVIPHVYRCFLQFAGPGGMILGNVIHVLDASDPPALDVAQAVGKAWAATGSIYAMQSSVSIYQQVSVIPLDGTSSTISDPFSTAAHTAGADTGAVFPANTSAVLKLKTGNRGRSHRDRIYVGQISNTRSTDLLHWSASYLTQMVT